MEDQEPGLSGSKKGSKTEKSKAKNDEASPSTEPPKKHQTISEMVHEAIEIIGVPRKGASAQAIKKYVRSKAEMEEKKLNTLINKALQNGIETGTLAKPSKQATTGATGSFLLVKSKPKQTKKLAVKDRTKKLAVKERSEKLAVEEQDDSDQYYSSDSETVSETQEAMAFTFSDPDIGDIDEEEETPKLKPPQFGKANAKKMLNYKEEAKLSKTKKVNNENAKASGRKKVNNEETKASRTKKVNDEAKASRTKKVNDVEGKASRTKKVNDDEAKASTTKKVNDEQVKPSRTKKANEEAIASGPKKVNKEEAKANRTNKVNMKDPKETAMKRPTRQKVMRERADSSDSEVVVKKTERKSMKAYSSDTDIDFVELEDVRAPSKKPKVQAKVDKSTSSKQMNKTRAVKLYNAEANENNIKSGKTRLRKKS